jgi:hypothetical protein
MAASTDNVRLGTGRLYLGLGTGVDVGYIENLTYNYSNTKTPFVPSTLTVKTKEWITEENFSVDAVLDEFNLESIRQSINAALDAAASVDAADWDTETGDTTGFTPEALSTWDVQHFGGKSCITSSALRFEHDLCDGKKLILVLFKVNSGTDLSATFEKTQNTKLNVSFTALADETREAGKQVGFWAIQTA